VVSGTTIESLVYNGQVDDVTADLNTARPIVSGGTGANNAAGGLFNLGGEKATQVVTSYDTHIWVPGSFRSAVGATGAPNANAFAGVCYIGEALANPPTNANVVVEARDLSDTADPGIVYVRQKIAGVWGGWVAEAGRSNSVVVDADQIFTETQKAQGRENIYAAPLDALAYNGMQINGSMEVSQEKGTTTNPASGYAVDGWSTAVSGGTVTATQQTGGPLASGVFFAKSLGLSASVAVPNAAGTYAYMAHSIEGYRVARLGWGSAGAQSVTIGFWVYSNNAGTMAVALRNAAVTRMYVVDVPVTAAVWQYKTVTIPGDITGTWVKDNTTGIGVFFTFAGGSTFQTTAGAWATGGNFFASPATTNLLGTNGSAVYLTGVVILPGNETPSAERSAFILRPYDQELLTCQRYFEMWSSEGASYLSFAAGSASSTTVADHPFVFKTEKRSAPTISVSSPTHFAVLYNGFTAPVVCASVTLALSSRYGMTLRGTVAGGLPAFGLTSIAANSTAQAKLFMDARI
jgi:hypothetical protein